MSRPPPRGRNFPAWNYGYTLGPPAHGGNGDYTMMMRGGPRGFPPQFGRGGRMPFRGGFRGRGGPPMRGRGGGPRPQGPPAAAEAKEEGGQEAAAATAKEDGEIVERPLTDILSGRNPIMFCNDQAKLRGLRMEWTQVSETGPPHDKTFTWSLAMGADMQTTGTANSKKTAKNKAAEEMAKKLDLLPKVNKRPYYGGHGPPPGFYHPMGPPPPWMMMKRRRMDGGPPMMAPGQEMAPPQEGEAAAAGEAPAAAAPKKELPKLINASQNNPISKLYEHCKRLRLPEPVFQTIAENVLDKKMTSQGFMLKKTEFTLQCSVQDKQFVGTAMTKKQAKYNAAAAAWAEIGAGVGQASIDSLLQSQRTAVDK